MKIFADKKAQDLFMELSSSFTDVDLKDQFSEAIKETFYHKVESVEDLPVYKLTAVEVEQVYEFIKN